MSLAELGTTYNTVRDTRLHDWEAREPATNEALLDPDWCIGTCIGHHGALVKSANPTRNRSMRVMRHSLPKRNREENLYTELGPPIFMLARRLC